MKRCQTEVEVFAQQTRFSETAAGFGHASIAPLGLFRRSLACEAMSQTQHQAFRQEFRALLRETWRYLRYLQMGTFQFLV